MNIVEELLCRQAVELSAVIGDHSETIVNQTCSFLTSEFGVELPLDAIKRIIDRESTSRLFFACGKERPNEIRNPYNCLRIARNLWLDYFLCATPCLSEEQCIKEAERLYEREKALSPNLDQKQSPLVPGIKKLFSDKSNVESYINYLEKTKSYLQAAFYVLAEFFVNTTAYSTFNIYNPFSSDEIVSSQLDNVEENNDLSAHEDDNKAAIRDKDSRVKYLEKSIHELKVKLEYSKKDALRDIAMTASSSAFGAPLFELFNIKNDPNTPEHTASAISNLFLALESMDVRMANGSKVGNVMPYSEVEEGKYFLPAEEQINPDDYVKIVYPGIKLGKEMIVKPTIKKEISK